MVNVRLRQSKKEKKIELQSIVKSIILMILTFLFFLGLFTIGQIIRKEYNLYIISGNSMSPTLTEKDVILVNKRAPINRYDVIAFSVRGEDGKFIKRVIGVPGDTMFVQNNRMILSIGDYEDYETTYTFKLSSTVAKSFQDLSKIPKGSYFTIGDNIDISKDSRIFGFVYKEKIEGTIHSTSSIKK